MVLSINNKLIPSALFIAGACSISGQVILLRELMAACQGNELSLGAILAAWLLWGAAGSWAAGRMADRAAQPSILFVAALAAAALILPATVFASGLIRYLTGTGPAEMIGFSSFLWSTLVVLGPLCLVQGGFFALGSKILSDGTRGVGRAYVLESAGAGVGGVVLSLFLINRMQPVGLACALSLVMLAGGLAVLRARPGRRRAIAPTAAILLLAAACTAGTLSGWPDALRSRLAWKPMRLLEARNSLHGSLAAVDVAGEPSLYEDGLITATSGSRLQAEELVHVGLAQHRGPNSVLLIGGGLGGSLHEILKHPVGRVDYVELDPQVIALGRRHLAAEDLRPLSDPRVRVHYLDARYFVKTTSDVFDAVIMDLPGPRSARLNRMYSREFFGELKARLRPGGIVVFGIAGSEVSPSPEQRLLLASLRKTAMEVFANANVLPGETCLFVLSDAPLPAPDARPILARLDSLSIETVYVRREMLPFQLSPARAEGLRKALDQAADSARTNHDFAPVAYLYNLAEWAAHFRGAWLHEWLWAAIRAGRPWLYALPAGLVLAAGLALAAARRRRVGLAVAAGGMSQMVFQIVTLIGFQVLYGYMFYRVGVMVGVFMAGLAAGSFLVGRAGDRGRSEHAGGDGLSERAAYRRFLMVQAALCLYPLLVPAVFLMRPPPELFMLLPAVAGVIGGMQLPLAAQLGGVSRGVGRAAGGLYGLDLAGACAGAALCGPLLIPTLGLVGMCLWTALVNAAILATLLAWKR